MVMPALFLRYGVMNLLMTNHGTACRMRMDIGIQVVGARDRRSASHKEHENSRQSAGCKS